MGKTVGESTGFAGASSGQVDAALLPRQVLLVMCVAGFARLELVS
ncbi:hypothetical protein [Nocardia jiangxiensis]|nr:hypothetical protein [Nocardia jiangxiensis]